MERFPLPGIPAVPGFFPVHLPLPHISQGVGGHCFAELIQPTPYLQAGREEICGGRVAAASSPIEQSSDQLPYTKL